MQKKEKEKTWNCLPKNNLNRLTLHKCILVWSTPLPSLSLSVFLSFSKNKFSVFSSLFFLQKKIAEKKFDLTFPLDVNIFLARSNLCKDLVYEKSYLFVWCITQVFVCAYHNIRGTSKNDVTCRWQILLFIRAWSRVSFTNMCLYSFCSRRLSVAQLLFRQHLCTILWPTLLLETTRINH